MPRTAHDILPATLTFLVEEHRVCEAEALVHLMAQGNGHATWNPVVADAWRVHLRDHIGDFGPHPLFPLLYVRNSQIPRAIRAFEAEADTLAPDRALELFLEMLRLYALKRRVPLSAYATKIKRDRVGLITQERFAAHRTQLFDAGIAFLRAHSMPRTLVERLTDTPWIVYPIIREFLTATRDSLQSTSELPAWWNAIDARLATYSEERADIESVLTSLDAVDLPDAEREALRGRLLKRVARLLDLEQREAERKAKEDAYFASIHDEWLSVLTQLPILERSPKAWAEYQDFRDRYTPIAVGTAEEILPRLPREATYTVWEVGAILPFVEAKSIRLRTLKTKIRRVNPDEVLTWACPGLEHYGVEEGIRRPIVTHYLILRLKDAAYAVFNLTPPENAAS